MPKIRYTDIAFAPKSLDLISNANAIIEEYQDDNLYLTLRQLYYQFVARGLLANKVFTGPVVSGPVQKMVMQKYFKKIRKKRKKPLTLIRN